MRDDFWLQRVAAEVRSALAPEKAGTSLRLRKLRHAQETDTGGWMISIGQLGQLRLDLWLDRYAGPKRRWFYAGFYSDDDVALKRVIHLSRRQWPVVHTLLNEDVQDLRLICLKKPLPADKFNAPVAEHYDDDGFGDHYFGFYDRMRGTPEQIGRRFRQQAVDFFLDVARSLPDARAADPASEVYPRCENRRLVQAHLARERSRYLARECKERDHYECQVCGMDFASTYGNRLGAGFAEAHHRRPLGNQGDKVKTKLEDLVTVCANCHRMLHRMEGGPGDVKKLKARVLGNRARRKR